MSDRPIIFSSPMVRALLDGRKTQTRRVIKHRGDSPEFCGGRYDDRNDPEAWGWENPETGEWITLNQFRRYRFVPYAPGDRLWVREAIDKVSEPGDVFYRADYEAAHGNSGQGLGWKPSIHMPRWASRLTLTVTEVRVQRLQDISEEDAKAERAMVEYGEGAAISHRRAFNLIWNSLHGPDAWAANPWVAALTFTVQRGNIDKIGRAA